MPSTQVALVLYLVGIVAMVPLSWWAYFVGIDSQMTKGHSACAFRASSCGEEKIYGGPSPKKNRTLLSNTGHSWMFCFGVSVGFPDQHDFFR